MQEFDWENNISNKEEKIELGKKIAKRVKNGDVIGFGSGSTSYMAVLEIAKKVKQENLKIVAVPTSSIIKELCEKLEIPTNTIENVSLNWCFDGADEVDKNNWLIKGMGAALYKEKMNIKNSQENYILVDNSKFVEKLGSNHPVPVECFKENIEEVKKALLDLGAINVSLKMSNSDNTRPLITDNGNYIIHAKFENIEEDLENKINSIPGVLENGLFIGYKVQIIKQ